MKKNSVVQDNPTVRIMFYISIGLSLALAFFLSFHKIFSADLGGHIAAGNWIIDNMKFPGKDFLLYTVSKNYIDNWWLYQVVTAIVNKAGGEFGMVFFNSLGVVLSFVILIYRSRRVYGKLTFIYPILLTVTVIATADNYTVRPHIFSWLFLNLIMLALELYDKKKQKKYLYFLPIIMVLWANSHGTIYALGWIPIFCYWAGYLIKNRKIDKQLTIFGLASVAACFVNPYFHRGVFRTFEAYFMLQEGNVYKENITELQSTFSSRIIGLISVNNRTFIIHPILMLFVFLFLTVVSWLRSIDNRRVHEYLLLILFFYVLQTGVRNIGFFIFVMFPIIADGFSRGKPLMGKSNKKISETISTFFKNDKFRIGLYTAISIFLLFLIGRISTNDFYVYQFKLQRFGYSYSPLETAHQAGTFLRENKLTGRIFNHFNFGSILENEIPQKVYIDGRTDAYDKELYDEFLSANSPEGKAAIEKKYNPLIAIFPYMNEEGMLKLYKEDPTWRLVYFDEVAVIFLKKDYAPQVPIINEETILKRFPVKSKEERTRILNMKKYRGLLSGIFEPQYMPIGEDRMSHFCSVYGWLKASTSIALEGLRKSTVEMPFLYYNVGVWLRAKGDFSNALIAFKRFVRTCDVPAEKELKTAKDIISEISKMEKDDIKAGELNAENSQEFQQNLDNSIEAFKKGNADKAIEYAEKCLELNAKDPRIYTNLGMFWYNKGDKIKALNYWKKATEVGPELNMSFGNLYAIYYNDFKKYDSAAYYADEFIKRGGQVPQNILDFLKQFKH